MDTDLQQVAAPVRLLRLLMLLLPLTLLLQEETLLALVLSKRRPAALHALSAPAAARPRARPPLPFCTPQDTHRLCDGEGGEEVAVSVPAWALAALPPAQEMTALPDVLTLPWSQAEGSQHGEDGFAVREFFFGVEGGLVVESGALDGRLFSTSAMLVKALRWRAVHIEANPENFAALVANRPESLNINAGLCRRGQELHFVSDAAAAAAGLTARPGIDTNAAGLTPVSGFWEFMSAEMRARWWAGLTDGAVAGLPATPCRSLSQLLQLFAIAHVHLWVLDVEGAELSALQDFDFAAVRVDVVLIELDGTNPGKDEACRALLRDRGFALHRRGHPHPFHMPDDAPQTDTTGPSAIGLDNEWWASARGDFQISYEAMARASRGDLAWPPHAQQRGGPYKDATKCCYSRDP